MPDVRGPLYRNPILSHAVYRADGGTGLGTGSNQMLHFYCIEMLPLFAHTFAAFVLKEDGRRMNTGARRYFNMGSEWDS